MLHGKTDAHGLVLTWSDARPWLCVRRWSRVSARGTVKGQKEAGNGQVKSQPAPGVLAAGQVTVECPGPARRVVGKIGCGAYAARMLVPCPGQCDLVCGSLAVPSDNPAVQCGSAELRPGHTSADPLKDAECSSVRVRGPYPAP